MNLSSGQIFINNNPLEFSFEIIKQRSKNQRRKDRKEYFKNKRKMNGCLSFEIPKSYILGGSNGKEESDNED